jgi:hypothetical protein
MSRAAAAPTTTRAGESKSAIASGLLQRKCSCGGQATGGGSCEACKEHTLQRRATQRSGSGRAPAIVSDVLRSPGRPLDHQPRTLMEQRFRHNFSDVRIHTDATAAASAQAVGASAYTVGRNIVFDRGRYMPDTPEGTRLIAHELTHVVQQRRLASAADSKSGVELGAVDDPAEREASHAETASGAIPAAVAGPQASPTLRRQSAPGGHAPGGIGGTGTQNPAATGRNPIETRHNVELGRTSAKALPSSADAVLDRGPALAAMQSGASERPPCKLELQLRIHFDFLTGAPPDGGYNASPNKDWPKQEANEWKHKYMQVAQNMWKTRRPLETAGKCAAEPCTSATGSLRVVDADTMMDMDGRKVEPVGGTTAHVNMSIYEVRPPDFVSKVSGSSARLFKEDILPLATPAPNSPAYTGSAGYYPSLAWSPGTAAHETGHMLGRPHVNCPPGHLPPDATDSNDPRCYGEPGSSESRNVMGTGSEFSREDHAPFINAMKAITGCDWQVSTAQLPLWAKILIGLTGIGLIVLALTGQL